MAIILSYAPDFSGASFKNALKSLKIGDQFEDLEEINGRKQKWNLIDGANDQILGQVLDDESRVGEYREDDPMLTDNHRWRIMVEACLESYTLALGRKYSAQLEITVPRIVDFKVEIKVRLLLANELSSENKTWIQGVFDGFAGGLNDLYAYIGSFDVERQNRNISFDDFDIIAYGLITKLDDKVDKSELEWYQDFYRDSETSMIFDSSQCVNDLPPVKEDPLRESEDDPDQTHERLKQTPEKQSCGNEFDIRPRKVATLLAYPEYKVIWKRKRIKVGCSTVKIKLPILQTRTRSKELYYSAISREELSRYIERVALKCLKDSAKVGLVVGLALKNVKAALAVFRVLFDACIYAKIGEKFDCFFPELFIKTVKTRWRRV